VNTTIHSPSAALFISDRKRSSAAQYSAGDIQNF
jgi:hypothetical protein